MSKENTRKLKVNITYQNLLDFNDYYYENSKIIKSAILKDRLVMTVSPLMGGLTVIFLKEMIFCLAIILISIILLLVSLPIYLLYPRFSKKKYRKGIKKFYSESENKGVLCEHEYTIKEDALLEKTEVNQTIQTWNSIKKVVQYKEDTYVFISSEQAYLFPKASVIEGDYDLFVEELKSKISNS